MSLLFEHPCRCHGLVPEGMLSDTGPAIPTRCLATKNISRGKNVATLRFAENFLFLLTLH